MAASYYEIRLCPNCRLRYPLTEGHPFGTRCPACLGETQVVLKRTISLSPPSEKETKMRGKFQLSALLDNIRSAWNVGSIFRTADGLGVGKLYLCGITPTPENESVTKTSLGAEDSVEWAYSRNALDMANLLQADGYTLIALEQDERAIPVGSVGVKGLLPLRKTVLILGNEVSGVDPDLLDLCNQIIHIPMKGTKRSLNVEVAFGIAVNALLSEQTVD